MTESEADAAQADLAAPKRPPLQPGVEQLLGLTRTAFTLSPDLPVDDDARRRVAGLIDGFVERQRALYDSWTRQVQELPDAGSDFARAAVLEATFLDALGQWRLGPAGGAHRAAVRAAALSPASCSALSSARSAIDVVAILVDRTPPAERDKVMDGERQLLSSWGTAAPAAPAAAPGLVDPLVDIGRAVEAMRHGRPADGAPLPPIAAKSLLVETHKLIGRGLRCAELQWWLARRLGEGTLPTEEVWSAWSFASARALVVGDRELPPYPHPFGNAAAPALARALALNGVVDVRMSVDASGHVVDGAVLARHVAAGRLPAGRQVRFVENLLDGPSLARAGAELGRKSPERARSAEPDAAASEGSGPSLTTSTVDMPIQWKLPQ